MGAGHAHPLYREGNSPVHRMAPQVKIAAAFLFVCCVVATPREAFWAFGAFLVVLLAVWAFAMIPVGWFAKRALIEAPFVVLVILLPFADGGTRVAFAGLSLSEHGLLAGWNILAKGTLGVLTSLTLAGTTPLRDLLLGLRRLRAPSVVTTIATLMLRYVDVIVGEARRMRLARVSRGHDPRFITQAGATARGVGSLFLRSYERGERVHLAMLARGWDGAMPVLREVPAGRAQWLAGFSVVAVAIVLVVTAWLIR
jgi:cobalt/nickel transport system permease protein